jgi:hypothetical protein
MKYPTIKDLASLVSAVKATITPYCRASEDDSLPSVLLTVAISEDGSWDYQTGDNSYSGGCYFHPYWAVVSICRRSNCRAIARDILEQWRELIY